MWCNTVQSICAGRHKPRNFQPIRSTRFCHTPRLWKNTTQQSQCAFLRSSELIGQRVFVFWKYSLKRALEFSRLLRVEMFVTGEVQTFIGCSSKPDDLQIHPTNESIAKQCAQCSVDMPLMIQTSTFLSLVSGTSNQIFFLCPGTFGHIKSASKPSNFEGKVGLDLGQNSL